MLDVFVFQVLMAIIPNLKLVSLILWMCYVVSCCCWPDRCEIPLVV